MILVRQTDTDLPIRSSPRVQTVAAAARMPITPSAASHTRARWCRAGLKEAVQRG